MSDPTKAQFQRLVTAIVARYLAQTGQGPRPAGELERLAAQLHRLVVERGLPPPLPPGDPGTPGGMAEEECAPLVARVLEGIDAAPLADAARQLVKACFYPEFRNCRDSFREVARDGTCRRQELARVRGRISGAHCVDCPHWIALDPAQHAAYLRHEWRREPETLAQHPEVFLPEDFRALRRWLHAAARSPRG